MISGESNFQRLIFFLLSSVVPIVFTNLTSMPQAHAGVLIAAGTGSRFEYQTDGRTLLTRHPIDVRAGYGFPFMDAYLEYQNFSTSDGLALASVGRSHHELIAWAKRIFLPDWQVKPYAALGSGVQFDEITTSFNGESSKATGRPELLFTGAFGASVTLYDGLEVQLEARLVASSNYAPNPLPEVDFFVGYRF